MPSMIKGVWRAQPPPRLKRLLSYLVFLAAPPLGSGDSTGTPWFTYLSRVGLRLGDLSPLLIKILSSLINYNWGPPRES